MNSGITSLAVGKSAQFKMQFKKSPSDSMSFFTAYFSRHSEIVKNIPCWKVLSHVSEYLSVMIRTWSSRRSTILTSKAVLYINMQTAVPVFSLHKSWHVNQKTMGFPAGSSISASLWIFQPRVGTSSSYDSRQRSVVEDTQKDRLVVALWWVLRFFTSATI